MKLNIRHIESSEAPTGMVLSINSIGIPVWGPVPPWIAVNGFTRGGDTSFAVEDTPTSQGTLRCGAPVRYRGTGGSWRYGMITGYNAGVVSISGAPMSEDSADELQCGDTARVAQLMFTVPGGFAAAARTDLLSFSGQPYWWDLAPGHIVCVSARAKTAYGTAPGVGLTVGSVTVLSAPIVVGVARSFGTITASGQSVLMGSEWELTTTAGGGTVGADLSVSVVVALE